MTYSLTCDTEIFDCLFFIIYAMLSNLLGFKLFDQTIKTSKNYQMILRATKILLSKWPMLHHLTAFHFLCCFSYWIQFLILKLKYYVRNWVMF